MDTKTCGYWRSVSSPIPYKAGVIKGNAPLRECTIRVITNPNNALFVSGNPSNLPYICCLFDPQKIINLTTPTKVGLENDVPFKFRGVFQKSICMILPASGFQSISNVRESVFSFGRLDPETQGSGHQIMLETYG